MIDKGLYRKNFYVGGGADMGQEPDSQGNVGPGPGGNGGNNNRGRDLDFQQRGRPKTSVRTTGGDIFAPNDPTAIEKMDYFGPTVFGPARKFTGSFLDNIFGGGYRNVTPSGRQFESRFSQMGGLGKGILGGLISLINPVAGLAYKGISSLGALKDYDNLADFAKGEFGLFQDEDEDEEDVLTGRDLKGFTPSRMGIMQLTPQPKPGINLNDYMGLENRFNVPSANPQDYDFFSNAMAKLNQVEQRAYDTLKMGKELGINTEKQNKQLEELEQKKNESSLMTGLA